MILVCVCIYQIARNRATRPCHPSHCTPFALILPRGGIICVYFIFTGLSIRYTWQLRGTEVEGSYRHGDSTLLSNQQALKWRQNPCRVQPAEIIGNLSVSRQCRWCELQLRLSGVLSVNLNFKLQIRLSDVLPHPTKSSKVTQNVFLSDEGYTNIEGYTNKTRYGMTLNKEWHRPMSKRFIKRPSSISRATTIDSDCSHLPTVGAVSNKEDKSRSS